MSRVGRLAGALLVETEGAYYLVGHLKRPCDFAAAGLVRPPDVETAAPRGVRLEAAGEVALVAPYLTLELEGEALIRLLAERLVVERTGLVSERLWRLILSPDPTDPTVAVPEIALDARWLGEVPPALWQLIRDAVLRCA